MSKRLLLLASALCSVVFLAGDNWVGAYNRASRVVLAKYDLDSATYIYCAMSDLKVGPGRIETSGSSSTVTAVSGTVAPYTDIAVGDEIVASGVLLSSPVTWTMTARTSATSATADRAINLDVADGVAFRWRDLACGTADTDGWFPAPVGANHLFITYRRGDLTGGVDYSVETRPRGTYGLIAQRTTGTIATPATTSSTTVVSLAEGTGSWRVGLKYNTADPSDSGANLDQVDIVLVSMEY
jgi:hypothetical protein